MLAINHSYTYEVQDSLKDGTRWLSFTGQILLNILNGMQSFIEHYMTAIIAM